MSEIQPPDPEARRRAAGIVAVTLVVGVFVVVALDSHRAEFERWVTGNADALFAHPGRVAGFGLLLMVPVLVATLFIWRYGAAVVAARRMPPPGTPVTRPTRVISGDAAHLSGRLLQAFAVLLALTCLALPAVLWYVFATLGSAG